MCLQTFLCLPMMLPWLPTTTAVFHTTSPCAASRSRMELMMTCKVEARSTGERDSRAHSLACKDS